MSWIQGVDLIISWEVVPSRRIPSSCRQAFVGLLADFEHFLHTQASMTLHNYYIEGRVQGEDLQIWHFLLPAEYIFGSQLASIYE